MQSINNYIIRTECSIDMKQMVLEREFYKLSLQAKKQSLTDAQLVPGFAKLPHIFSKWIFCIYLDFTPKLTTTLKGERLKSFHYGMVILDNFTPLHSLRNIRPRKKKGLSHEPARISIWTHFCRITLRAEPNFWLFSFFLVAKKKMKKNSHFALLIF